MPLRHKRRFNREAIIVFVSAVMGAEMSAPIRVRRTNKASGRFIIRLDDLSIMARFMLRIPLIPGR